MNPEEEDDKDEDEPIDPDPELPPIVPESEIRGDALVTDEQRGEWFQEMENILRNHNP